jgi:hypothetical protein
VTLAQVRKHALSLPGTIEEPHFDRTSFRVKGKIFATARPSDPYIHVFVPEETREAALAMHPEYISRLVWGGKVVGLRIVLSSADSKIVKSLVSAAWQSKSEGRKVSGQHCS